MKKSYFRIVVGITNELSEEDIAKLTPELRRVYSLCGDYVPGAITELHGQLFESFHIDQPDGTRKYAAFGIDFSGHPYEDFGVYSFTNIGVYHQNAIYKEVLKQARQVFSVECHLNVYIGTYFLLGCSS